MTDVAVTADQIARAVEDIAKRRPAYRPLLDYYGRMFAAQAAARQRIQLPPPVVTEEETAQRRQNGFALLGLSDFTVDIKGCIALLRELCAILAATRPESAAAAIALATEIESGERDAAALFRAVLEETDAVVADAAEKTGLAADLLAALLYQSMEPSLQHISSQAAALLPADTPPHTAHCPVCGSDPVISAIAADGNRTLLCGFCWHRWPVRRVACPHCGDAAAGNREYLYDPAEKEYRVDVCKICRRYMKTVDLRQITRPFYPPLEQVATLHLDMLAKEKGFITGP
ncbi:MAG: formate dehydrogenase accessory protein FdhE [Pseudomonadota bacterium]